ncbi:hypothetical protein SAMN05892877_107269 [Rhizobium subbaraonis]|uniref:Uncharacterized protein n=1 Tax=Rhizobium subbaraonis TaxID=908946 RepID=A0A285UGH2_9HYPH|nr:hypothetical protein [Rhizobium subbaraonis]SOC40508.1 hypothetical protein SAMN05892877_107269 [Rhizobium subbaraonis]
MPLQNRVTPFADIVAVEARGLFTGNRGILHDPATRTLTRRRWTTKAWITCACEYKGIRREVMARRSWTELFFLDEATALAAGHRPCFLCRRDAALAFRQAWSAGRAVTAQGAADIDAVLHMERLDKGRKRLHPLRHPVTMLPDGAMVAAGGSALLVRGGRTLLWQPGGYRPAPLPAVIDGVLTPPSTLAALAAGYSPVLHPSACYPED